jgi:hypothetical protein
VLVRAEQRRLCARARPHPRLVGAIKKELSLARREAGRTGRPARRFKDLERWQTRKSWSRARRVVAKAEWTGGEANPRFVVTSLHWAEAGAQFLYEGIYCQRGEMENRFKECQTDLFAGRTSAATMQANQLRLWFASMAYVLMCAVRRIGLEGTKLARATCGTIRLKLLKIGALVTVSVRRVKFAFATACPDKDVFGLAHERLRRASWRSARGARRADAPPPPEQQQERRQPEPAQPRPTRRMMPRGSRCRPRPISSYIGSSTGRRPKW